MVWNKKDAERMLVRLAIADPTLIPFIKRYVNLGALRASHRDIVEQSDSWSWEEMHRIQKYRSSFDAMIAAARK